MGTKSVVFLGRYEDFFESKKKGDQNKKPKVNKEVEDIEMSEEEEEEEEEKEEENEDSETGDEDMESDDEVVFTCLEDI